ncbi:hypothetical protein FGO68_gene2662 [Halteria grandinella]|uniref:Tetratricopeptide repeat protein n=1 Tax=Halteria grandinella TaxID=5974 RepID=A0A8J8P288_HALGN|nr:hypothetical protein FGO68_gene2662 [Halteria grandinella]
MMLKNFTVNIEQFAQIKQEQKSYTLGVMFESKIIEEKIAETQKKFYRIFLVLFMMPFLGLVILFLVSEILFIISFTKKIFQTINDLFEKINLLNKHHRSLVKQKSLKNGGKIGDSFIKLSEQFDEYGLNLHSMTSLFGRKSSILSDHEEQVNHVDVLHDYQGNESCMEVTKLYRAANKLIKTISLAKTSIMQGNDNTALLSYNEVAHLFLERNNQEAKIQSSKHQQGEKAKIGFEEQKGERKKRTGLEEVFGLSSNLSICYNNIACIYAKKQNFFKQILYLTESIRIEELLIRRNYLAKNFTTKEENFRLACKYFNYGYCFYRENLKLNRGMKNGQPGKLKDAQPQI